VSDDDRLMQSANMGTKLRSRRSSSAIKGRLWLSGAFARTGRCGDLCQEVFLRCYTAQAFDSP